MPDISRLLSSPPSSLPPWRCVPADEFELLPPPSGEGEESYLVNNYVTFQLFLTNTFEKWERVEVLHHPVMKLFDVCDCINDTTWSQNVRVLRQECLTKARRGWSRWLGHRGDANQLHARYNTSFMLPCFEVWIGEEEEYL